MVLALKLAELTLIPSLILKIIGLRSRQIVELLQISHARPDSEIHVYSMNMK